MEATSVRSRVVIETLRGALQEAMELITALDKENNELKFQSNQHNEMPPVLNAKFIKEYLGISQSKVYELLHTNHSAGGIKAFKDGDRWLVKRENFKDWLDKKELERG